MDADAAYERIKSTTRKVVQWSRLGIFLGMGGMVGSYWITSALEAFFMFFAGIMVAGSAFAMGLMANISLSDYARDKAWRERKRESDTWL
jgi:hypothetical protein